ncbi:PAS domain-containing sensor histidine kinase [Cupriavidus neocaledonicus]|uniref:Signal transduction histidine kinase n=2 Tax=Cupriavidus neocaledonicus TaxID=1040979 RepID=A0ABY1VGS6_9BURK|nr:PAS domain-containing sensor histidine kinase [Cupriavidus neocaledonicus]SOZ40909.1 Signal transduction histidine kinase [Cupriavidus neocaledonicus]
MTGQPSPQGKFQPFDRLHPRAIDFTIGMGTVAAFMALAYLVHEALLRYWEVSSLLAVWLGAGIGLMVGLFLVRRRRVRHRSSQKSASLEKNEARMSAIIRSSVEAIITVDSEQRVVLFNPMAEALFAWPAELAIGRPLGDFIPERFRAAHEEHVRRFAITGVSERQMGRQRALFALRRDGSEFPIEASISQTVEGGTRLFTVMLRDITERARADEALRTSLQRVKDSEARLAGIIRSSMEAIITVDSDQRVVLFNPMAETLFAWPAAEAIGRPLADFIPERFRQAHEAHVRRFGVTGVSDRAMGRQRALYALRRDGTEFPIEASISQIADQGTRLYTVMLRDITDRVRAEDAMRRSREALQHLSDSILSTREEEKRRIARELHDDLGQRLSAMKMDLAMLGADLKEGKSMQSLLAGVAAMNIVIDETVASVRRIASDLRPALLDELGMLPAIEWLAGDCAKRYGLSVVVDGTDIEVPEQVAIAMFRIVQEALSNVVRHANATEVRIRVAHDQGRLELQVQDNGVGWDKVVEDDEPRKSLGLLGIRERARLLGGTVDIDSAPGQGFCVAIRIPQAKREDMEAGPAG